MHRVVSSVLVTISLLALGCLGGCSAAGEPSLEVPAGQYSQAFEATREALREYDFTLDRVDAASGVITSAVKPSSGLATPWDSEQTGIDQEWEDFINRQRRSVRVAFVPVEQAGQAKSPPRDPASALAPDLVDLRDYQGAVVATVSVTIERVQRPGWQVNTKSINQSTFMRDPELVSKGMQPSYAVELEPDERLARRIADRIRKKLASAAPE
ncbi:MAG TPA: hypothetical protein VK176_05900 [Phycisphaerales bacterium]|nr:hypothetical protein [Phycisphaerales bacterium]